MVKDRVLQALQRYFGEYVRGLSSEALKLSVWNGNVVLKDLQLKAEALNALKLPITVKAGFLGSVTLKIPWNLLGREAVIVLLDRVFILAEALNSSTKAEDEESWEELKRRQIEEKELTYLEAKHKRTASGENASETSTWSGYLFARIVGNLKISITNLHIRYEDTISNPGRPFCSGITLAKLDAVTVDETGNETFVISEALERLQKKFELQRLAVYHDSNTQPWNRDKGWKDLMPSEWSEVFEAGISTDATADVGYRKWALGRRYLLHPVDGSMRYHRRGKRDSREADVPFQSASLRLDQVSVVVSEAQYGDGMKLRERVSRYRLRMQYSHFRPQVPIFEDKRAWWLYAYQAILQQQSRIWCHLRWVRVIDLCKKRRKYISLYASCLDQGPKVDNEEIKQLERNLDVDVIVQWRLLAHAKVETAKSKGAAMERQPVSSWWPWTFGWGAADGDCATLTSNARPDSETGIAGEEWGKSDNLVSYKAEDELATSWSPEAPNMIQMALEISIGQSGAEILNKNDMQILCGKFEDLQVSLLRYPKTQKFSTKLKFYRLSAPEGGLIESVNRDGRDHALTTSFIYCPLDDDLDWKLAATMSPCHVTVLRVSFDRFLCFLKSSQDLTPGMALETAAVLRCKLEEVTRRAQEQLQFALKNQSKFSVNLDLDAPKISIPVGPIENGEGTQLLLDLGRFELHTALQEEEYKSDHTGLYSRFHIFASEISAFLADGPFKWSDLPPNKAAEVSEENSVPESVEDRSLSFILPVFDRCGISVVLDQIRVQHPSYPATRVHISVPHLGVHFSPGRYRRILLLLSALNGGGTSMDGIETPATVDAAPVWHPADYAGDAKVLLSGGIGGGIGHTVAKWQPCWSVLSGSYLYILQTETAQSYQRCSSIAGKQLLDVSPERIGGLKNVIAIYDRGVDVQTAVKSSHAVLLQLKSKEIQAAWLDFLDKASSVSTQPQLFVSGLLDELQISLSGSKNRSGYVGANLCHEETLILQLQAKGGKVDVLQSQYKTLIGVTLHTLKIEDKLQGHVGPMCHYIAKSAYAEDDDEQFEDAAQEFGRDSPDQSPSCETLEETFSQHEEERVPDFVKMKFAFRNKEPLDSQIDVRMATLEFFCNRPTVVAMIDFGMEFNEMTDGDALLSTESVGDTERYIVKGLLRHGKSRIICQLKMTLQSVRIFLNKEDGSQLAVLTKESFSMSIKVYPGSFSVSGKLGNLRICDSILGPDHRWRWLCNIHDPDCRSIVEWDFCSFNVDDDDYRGYEYSLSGKLSAVHIVYLNRFIQEIIAYFHALATPQVEQVITVVDKVRGIRKLIQKSDIEGIPAFKLNVSLESPIIVMPKNSKSKEFMQLDLGHLQISNRFHWHGGEKSEHSAVHIDVLSTKVTDLNIVVGIDSKPCKPMIKNASEIHITVKRPLRDVFKKFPELQVGVEVDVLCGVISDKEYLVIIDCASTNLSEEPNLPPRFRDQMAASGINDEEFMLLESPEEADDQTSQTKIRWNIDVRRAELELCIGVDRELPLARLEIGKFWLNYCTTTALDADLYITLPKLSVMDLRADTKPEMRLMLGSMSDIDMGTEPVVGGLASHGQINKDIQSGSEPTPQLTMLVIDMKLKHDSQEIEVRVQRPRLLVVADFLLALKEFFGPPLSPKEDCMDMSSRRMSTPRTDKPNVSNFRCDVQVVAPELTFYDSTKWPFGILPHRERLLRTKLSFNLLYNSEGQDKWIKADVKSLFIEGGSGIVVVDPVDATGEYTCVKNKPSMNIKCSDISMRLTFSVISLIMRCHLNAVSTFQFGDAQPLCPCTHFDRICATNEGSNTSQQITIWRPRAPPGYAILSDCATSGIAPPSQAVMAVSKAYQRLRKPLRFDPLLSTYGDKQYGEVGEIRQRQWSTDARSCWTVWVPVPPPGYVAVGCVAELGTSPPPLTVVHCLRSDLVTSGSVSDCLLSSSPGSRAEHENGSSIWRIENAAGSFFAHSSIEPPPKSSLYDLSELLWHVQDNSDSDAIVCNRRQGTSSAGSCTDLVPSVPSACTGSLITVPQFERIWWDRESESQRTVSIWRPIPPSGYTTLGDCLVEGLEPPSSGMALREDGNGILVKPTKYLQRMNTSAKGLDDVYIWFPVAPAGYVAIGCIATKTQQVPLVEHFRCVHVDHVSRVNFSNRPLWSMSTDQNVNMVWNIGVNRLKYECSLWKVDNKALTFIARPDLKRPPARLALQHVMAFTLAEIGKQQLSDSLPSAVKIGRLSTTVYNDLSGKLTPVVDMAMKVINLFVHVRREAFSVEVNTRIEASTFNEKRKAWELLIEPVDGNITFKSHDLTAEASSTTGKRLCITTARGSVVNMNLTSAAVETLVAAMLSWRGQVELEDKARMEKAQGIFCNLNYALEEENLERVVIENDTGNDFYLRTLKEKFQKVLAGPAGQNALVHLPVPPLKFPDKFMTVSDAAQIDAAQSRHYAVVHVSEAKDVIVNDDGNGQDYLYELRVVPARQSTETKKLLPQSWRSTCVRPSFLTPDRSPLLATVKWNEVFIFEVIQPDITDEALLNMDVIVTNMAAEGGKGQAVGDVSIPMNESSGRWLSPSSLWDVLRHSRNIVRSLWPANCDRVYDLQLPRAQEKEFKRQKSGSIAVNMFFFTSSPSQLSAGERTGTGFQNEQVHGSDISISFSTDSEGPWTDVRSIPAVGTFLRQIGEQNLAMEVFMQQNTKHVKLRSLVKVVNDIDMPLAVCICPFSCLNSPDGGTAADGADVDIEEVFESHRFQPQGGWDSKWPGHLMPTDPGRWSSPDLSTSSQDFMDKPLPPGWIWTSCWFVDKAGHVDTEGWYHGADFQSLTWPPSSPRARMKSVVDFVRRRRWIRTRQRVIENSYARTRQMIGVVGPNSSISIPLSSIDSNSDFCVQVRPHNDPVQHTWGRAIGDHSATGSSQSVDDSNNVQMEERVTRPGVPISAFLLYQLEETEKILECLPEPVVKSKPLCWLNMKAEACTLDTERNMPVYDWRLSVSAPLKLQNQLPCKAEFTVWEIREGDFVRKQQGVVSAGDSVNVYVVDLRRPVYLTWIAQGGWDTDLEHVLISDPSNKSLSSGFWMTHLQNGRKLWVSLENNFGKTAGSAKTVRLYVPYWLCPWLCHDAAQPLSYRLVEIKPNGPSAGDNSRLKNFRRWLRFGESRKSRLHTVVQDLGPLEVSDGAPVMLSLQAQPDHMGGLSLENNSEGGRISPRLGLGITIGNNTPCEDALSFRELEENTERVEFNASDGNGAYYKISAFLNELSDGTKVVHLQRQAAFVNRMGENITLRQDGLQWQNDPVPLDAPRTFLWHTSVPERLQIRMQNYKWSQPFKVDAARIMQIILEAEDGRDLVVQAEVCNEMQGSRFLVVFRRETLANSRIQKRTDGLSTGTSDSWKINLQSSSSQHSELLRPEAETRNQFILDFAELGVSIVDHTPRELLYMNMQKLDVQYEAWRGSGTKRFEFHVDGLQIDNQLPLTPMPVLFSTPDSDNHRDFLLKLTAKEQDHGGADYLSYPIIDFHGPSKAFVVKIHEPILWQLHTMFTEWNLSRLTSQTVDVTIDPQIHIGRLTTTEIRLKVTLAMSPNQRPSGKLGFWSFIMTSVGNTYQMELCINSRDQEEMTMRQSAVRETALWSVLKELAPQLQLSGVDVLGNTATAFGHMGKTAAGLSKDPKFIQGRLEQDKRANVEGIGDGVRAGSEALAKGVFKGGKGLFTKPYKGARSSGMKGFAKGVVEGIIGAVTQSASGACDFLSKTTEGVRASVKRTAAFNPEEQRLRRRLPRVIGHDNVLRPYDKHKAQGQVLMQLAERGTKGVKDPFKKGKKFAIEDAYVGHFDLLKDQTLMITHRRIILLQHPQETVREKKVDLLKDPCTATWEVMWDDLKNKELPHGEGEGCDLLSSRLVKYSLSQIAGIVVECPLDPKQASEIKLAIEEAVEIWTRSN